METHIEARRSGRIAPAPQWAASLAVGLSILTSGCSGVAGGVAGAMLSGLGAGAMSQPPSMIEVTESLGAVEGLPGSRVLAMDCGGRRVVISMSEAQAWLFLPGETLEMDRWFSDLGLVYFHGILEEMDPVDRQVTGELGNFQVDWQVVMKGAEVWLEQEQTRIECQVNRPETRFEAAKLAGADFRGLGNEPGWELVIWRDRMHLRYDYGASELEVPLLGPKPLAEETGSRFLGEREGRSLEVILRPGPCPDSMSDQVFETRVTVNLEGRSFQGCGKALH